jgi:hypothetical protein
LAQVAVLKLGIHGGGVVGEVAYGEHRAAEALRNGELTD